MENSIKLKEFMIFGSKAISIENNKVKMVILTDYGSKIYELIDKKNDLDFLYKNPRVKPRAPVFGVNAENWWSGGIDFCIPTCEECEVSGEIIPSFGEFWSQKWDYEVKKYSSKEVLVKLICFGIIYPLLVEEEVFLSSENNFFEIKYKLTNLSSSDLVFLWGLHSIFKLLDGFKLDIPCKTAEVYRSLPDNKYGEEGKLYNWPFAFNKYTEKLDDLSIISIKKENSEDLHYLKLDKGYFSIKNEKKDIGIKFNFGVSLFRYILFWRSLGWWRSHYCLGLENWSGYPIKLSEAIKKGVYTTLGSKDIIETKVKIGII